MFNLELDAKTDRDSPILGWLYSRYTTIADHRVLAMVYRCGLPLLSKLPVSSVLMTSKHLLVDTYR